MHKVSQPIRSSTMPVWETHVWGKIPPGTRPNVTLGLKAGGLSPSRACSESVSDVDSGSERLSPNMRLPRPLGSAVSRRRAARKRPFGQARPAGRAIQLSVQTRRALRGTEKFLRVVATACFPKSKAISDCQSSQNLPLRVQSCVGAVSSSPQGLFEEGRDRVFLLPQGGDAGPVADLFQLASALAILDGLSQVPRDRGALAI